MRLVHFGLGEVDVIGRNQRQAHRIGDFQVPPLADPLAFHGRAVLARVALQFDVKPVGVDFVKTFDQSLRFRALTRLQQLPHRPVRPA